MLKSCVICEAWLNFHRLVSIRVLAVTRSPTTSATHNSGEQTLESVSLLVHQTCLSVVSDDRELCQQVVRIYRRLGERREQMQQLGATIAHTQQSGHDSSTVDFFLDFVSRFSVNGLNSSIDRLLGAISGHPNYLLETSPSFYPEQYDTTFPDKMTSISAILPLPSHPRTQRYFMTFQEKARKWQRVIIVATFEYFRDPSAMIQVSAEANIRLGWRDIPERLELPLQRLVREIHNFGSVTSVSVNLKENETGQITADTTRLEKVENMLERQMSNENTILQEIEHLGYPQFVESQVVFKAQLSCYRYKVWVGDRDFTECKVPFASAGLQGENLFDDFTDEVKRLTSLRGCKGIVQFLGIILDDTRRHIKGYLYEAPIIPNLRLVIPAANSQSKPIPWAVRELWIGQIVAAMSNVHARGLVIGALNNHRISIRADGSIVLDLSECAHRQLPTQRDRLPPELWRMSFDTCRIPRSTPLNFQTDVFQLGFSIWLIAEHITHAQGYYCTRAVCTNVPRYQCTASHTEPTELPPCSVGIPAYINDLIAASRLPNPKHRPSASWLSTLFPPIYVESQKYVHDKYMKDAIRDYPSSPAKNFWCNECGILTSDPYYHCYICDSDDFDLCPTCYTQGIHCWNLQHHMVKRTVKGQKSVEFH